MHQWSFENNLNDTSGSGNNGVPNSLFFPTYVPGAFGQGFALGSGQGVSNLSPSNLPLGGDDRWTMNVWLNFEDPIGLGTANLGLFYYAGFGNHSTFTGTEGGWSRAYIQFDLTQVGTTGYHFWGTDSNGIAADVPAGVPYIQDGEWHMYTLAHTGDRIDMYIDATLVASGPTNLLDTPFNQVQIGNPSVWNTLAEAGIDEFSIYDGYLQPRDIGRLFATNFVPEPGALALAGLAMSAALGLRRRQA
ncbi:MAG: LamG-like jellyroll fold domain-containing protein [Planctomycetota bacterium]